MRKRLVIIATIICSVMALIMGCGEKESPDIKKAEEAISVYESMIAGEIDDSEAMPQVMLISQQIENEELSKLVLDMVIGASFDGMNGALTKEEALQRVKDYVSEHNK
jgi:hypothetical protein